VDFDVPGRRFGAFSIDTVVLSYAAVMDGSGLPSPALMPLVADLKRAGLRVLLATVSAGEATAVIAEDFGAEPLNATDQADLGRQVLSLGPATTAALLCTLGERNLARTVRLSIGVMGSGASPGTLSACYLVSSTFAEAIKLLLNPTYVAALLRN
jgi:hypothetical protein